MLKRINFTAIVVALAIVLALAQLGLSYFLASAGDWVYTIEEEIADLELKNLQLKTDINKNRSLIKIADEAEKLGLMTGKQVEIITSKSPIALNRAGSSE